MKNELYIKIKIQAFILCKLKNYSKELTRKMKLKNERTFHSEFKIYYNAHNILQKRGLVNSFGKKSINDTVSLKMLCFI